MRHSHQICKENREKSEESIKNPTSLIDLKKKKKVKAQAFPDAIYLKKNIKIEGKSQLTWVEVTPSNC